MRLRIGRPRHALIVAPHPDDEVIGAAGLIRALRIAGTAVTVLVVTDGAASHADSALWPRRRRVAERRRESRRALARLDVRAGAIGFLALPDGGLDAAGAACRRAVARAIRRQRHLDLIVAPVADDAHPDHRACAHAASGANRAVRRLGYAVWPPRRMRAGRWRSLAVTGGAAHKRSLIRSYATQLGAIRDAPGGFAIARHELDAFAHPVEHFLELRR